MTKEKFIQKLQAVNLKDREVSYNFWDVIKKVDIRWCSILAHSSQKKINKKS